MIMSTVCYIQHSLLVNGVSQQEATHLSPNNSRNSSQTVTTPRNKNVLRSGLAFTSGVGKAIGRTTKSVAEKAKQSAHSATQRTAQLSRQTAERTKNSAAIAKTKISKFDQQVNFTGAVTSVAIGKAAVDLVCRKNMKGCAESLSVAQKYLERRWGQEQALANDVADA